MAQFTKIVEEALEAFESGLFPNKAQAAKAISKKYGYNNSETIRKSINKLEKRLKHRALKEECETNGISFEDVKHYWWKGKHFSAFVKEDAESINYPEVISSIVESYLPKQSITIEQEELGDYKAIKATLSDMHVGLNPNPNNKSLFSYQYNEEIFKSNLNKVFSSILKERLHNGKFDLLIIDDLGDGLDGWNGETTRGGHKLDQNMDNETAFKVFVEGKLELIEKCISAGIANEILIRNVSNDNHSGSFASIANMTIKMILNRTYSEENVKFYILDKFMEHFKYGNHTFILTHGKDNKFMFRGLPYELNDKAIGFINDYIDHYDINTKYIHLEKGDLHRVGYSRTKKFDYRNYMSFAPPSAWVQHNFGDCYSGYSIQIIPKFTGEISHTDYYFELNKSL